MTDENAYAPELVHSGCDWITATALGGKRSNFLYESAELLLREAICRGNQKRPWSMSGFHGYKAGGVQCGNRGDEVMIRLSGDYAHDYWKEVYDDADNITRFDAQATFRLKSEVGPLIARHFEQAKRLSKNKRRAPTVSLFSTNNGPSTLYLNRRVSEVFARIYDKGAESGLPQLRGCIRYEVEYKGDAARRISAFVRSQAAADKVCARLAIEYMASRGCVLGKARICS